LVVTLAYASFVIVLTADSNCCGNQVGNNISGVVSKGITTREFYGQNRDGSNNENQLKLLSNCAIEERKVNGRTSIGTPDTDLYCHRILEEVSRLLVELSSLGLINMLIRTGDEENNKNQYFRILNITRKGLQELSDNTSQE
jgi:hypothetical protein